MIENEEDAQRWMESLPGYDDRCRARMELFIQLLVAENARQNLVANSSLAHMWQRHIVDSAQLLLHVPRGTSTWLDLGTGAGFPGLVIAVLAPAFNMTLVDSRTRRANWLQEAIDALELQNAEVRLSDVKNLSSTYVDVISARAFAHLDRLVSLSGRFSTSHTTWLLPKGRSARDELASLRGWRHTFHVEQSLTDAAAGIITGHLLGVEEQNG